MAAFPFFCDLLRGQGGSAVQADGAVLPAEGNAVAEHAFQPCNPALRVAERLRLAPCLLGQRVALARIRRAFQVDDCCALAGAVYDDEVGTALAALLVGIDHKPRASEDAGHEAVVEVLRTVVVADGFVQDAGEFFLYRFGITIP